MYFSSLLSLSALLLAARATDEPVFVDEETLEERAVQVKGDNCPKGPTVVVGPQVVYFPVKINNYYEQNTVINIAGGPTININNAPVYINTIVTASSTITTTSTVTVPPITPPTTTSPPFFLTINQIVLGKRQSGFNLLAPDGSLTTDCRAASFFGATTDGRLISNGQQISANPFATSEVFSFKSTGGAITTSFTLVNGNLVWYNPLFIYAEVSFCLLNGFVNAIFNNKLPTNCVAVALSYLDISQCSNNGTVTTAPPGTGSSTLTTSTSVPYSNTTTPIITSFMSTGTAFSSTTFSNTTTS